MSPLIRIEPMMTTRHALACSLILVLAAAPAAGQEAAATPATSRKAGTGMVRIPAGSYRPLYATGSDSVRVAAFALDANPVTRGDFLTFVMANPQWSRDAIATGSASRYLADWPDAHIPGTATDLRRPVTNITLRAARAYCSAQDKRLPTVDEWEYVAVASATRRDASHDPAFAQQLVTLYANRPRPLPPIEHADRNVYGVRGLHGLAWEWVADVGQAPKARHAHGAKHASHDAYCASAAVGATDPTNYAAFLRFAVRSSLTPDSMLGTLGFRCAR